MREERTGVVANCRFLASPTDKKLDIFPTEIKFPLLCLSQQTHVYYLHFCFFLNWSVIFVVVGHHQLVRSTFSICC